MDPHGRSQQPRLADRDLRLAGAADGRRRTRRGDDQDDRPHRLHRGSWSGAREYGIVKAIGGTRRHLVALAVDGTLALAAMGLVAGWVFFVFGRLVIVVEQAAVERACSPPVPSDGPRIAALVMALVAGVIPARRLARLEPAVAYRSAP